MVVRVVFITGPDTPESNLQSCKLYKVWKYSSWKQEILLQSALGIMVLYQPSNSLNLSSANYSLVNPPALPIVIQPWNAIDLDITFTPQARGLFKDSLVISSDAENYISLSVALTGRALEFTPPLPDLIYAAKDTLYNYSLSNLNASLVGWFEGTQIQGLTIRPTDSVLIGISTSAANSILYRIDPLIGGCLPLLTIYW